MFCPLVKSPKAPGAPSTIAPTVGGIGAVFSDNCVQFQFDQLYREPPFRSPGGTRQLEACLTNPSVKFRVTKLFCFVILDSYILGFFLNAGTILAAKPPYHIPAKFLSFSSQN